jgi:hypothetical protein
MVWPFSSPFEFLEKGEEMEERWKCEALPESGG